RQVGITDAERDHIHARGALLRDHLGDASKQVRGKLLYTLREPHRAFLPAIIELGRTTGALAPVPEASLHAGHPARLALLADRILVHRPPVLEARARELEPEVGAGAQARLDVRAHLHGRADS